jgi:predicted dehydrogenase
MVGYMKRYDPAYEELAAKLDRGALRFARITTLESPLEPYVAHYPLVRTARGAHQPEDDERVARALPDADDQTRWCYRRILLDSLVHELNLLRGFLGEPTEVTHAELSPQIVGTSLRFGETACHLSWVDLPGIARYSQELAFYAPDRRLTLTFPSPFLRSMPTRLTVEDGTPGTAEAWAREERIGFEEAFKRELIEFHDCILDGRAPRTSGEDGLRDVALCTSIARAHMTGVPVEHPTRTADQEVPQ